MHVIQHRLDLAVRLIDSVSLLEIDEKRVKFNVDTVSRGNGVYLFLGIEHIDFDLDVHVYGYEERKVRIVFDELDKKIPIKEIYLLPDSSMALRDDILTLRGNMPNIKEIEAVPLYTPFCLVKEFDKRERKLKIYNQYNVKLKNIHYGIIDMTNTEYEHVEVEKEFSGSEVRLKKPLEKEYTINQPVVPIIFGQTYDDGRYLLKVSAGENAEYLVRYVVDDQVCFKKINFNNPDETTL